MMRRHLPNLITLLRFLLLPVFVLAILEGARYRAISVLALIAFSDWLDGTLARSWHVESRFGAILDPLADKLCQMTALALLALEVHDAFTPVPVWFLVLVGARELLLFYGALRIRLSRGRVRVEARAEGKLSTLLVFLVLFLALLGVRPALVWAGALLTAPVVIAAAVRYTVEGSRQLTPGGGAPPAPR